MDDLPAGIGDEQSPGHYGLVSHGIARVFDYTVGPTEPRSAGRSRRSSRSTSGGATAGPSPSRRPRSTRRELAFLGVRACELAALGIQDRVFLGGPYTDEDYAARRRNALSSRSTAPRRPRPASAPRWAPGPRSAAATTSCSPSSTRGSWSGRGRPRGGPHRAAARSRRRRAARCSAPRRRSARSPRTTIGDPVADRRPARSAARPVRQPAVGQGRRAVPRRAPTARWSARPASAAA